MTTTLEHDPDSGCDECPLMEHDGHVAWCQAGERHRGVVMYIPAPAWCPLRAGPVTVRRKERAT
jgi:hypothetical protein